MRIIAGAYRGKTFYPPRNIPARPTTDFAKEALFNVIANHFDFEEVHFLDLFAGTGSLDMEFFSRGCKHITSVDLSPISIGFIRKMSETLKIANHQIIKGDALHFVKGCFSKYDIIFAGPPYALEEIDSIPDLVLGRDILKEKGWFILETSPKHNFKEHPHLLDHRKYGQTNFWFFGKTPHHE